MALLRTVLCSRHSVLHLLSKSQNCANEVLQITSKYKLSAVRLYSSSNNGRGYKTMLGQDLDEEPVKNSLPDYGVAIGSWHFDVNSTGRLNLRSQVPVHIESLDHQKFPEMKTVFMNMLYIGKDRISGPQMTNMTKSFIVSAALDEDETVLDLDVDLKQDLKEIPNVQCHLQVPVKYDIDVSCQDKADASLKMLESETITVNTEQGSCLMNNLKCNSVDIRSEGGDIRGKTLVQGNINMVTKSEGSIDTGRLQGQTINCETVDGDIRVTALYSETCKIKTSSGGLLLSNCHGTTEIESDTGDVSIDTMDGDLLASVKGGDVSVFLAREGDHNISSETGNITIKLPSLKSNIELKGKLIDHGDVPIFDKEETDEESLKHIKGCLVDDTGECGGRLKASTLTGRIELQPHSWFSSLNLNNTEE